MLIQGCHCNFFVRAPAQRNWQHSFWVGTSRFTLEMFLSVEKLRNPIPCDVKRSRCIGRLYGARDFAQQG